jgi:hypothetical protein
MVRSYANIEEILVAAKEVERVLGELGETPFEPLKEEQEEGMNTQTNLEKQIIVLNESFINFFKGTSSSAGNPFSRASSSSVCQICKSSDHIATMCLHVGNLKPKCDKCGLPHKTKNCGVKCGYCYGMGHIEDKCTKRGKDGKTKSTSNNYLKVLVNDEGYFGAIKQAMWHRA